MLSPTAPTISPSVTPLECKTLLTPTAKEPAEDAHPPPNPAQEVSSEKHAHLTLPIAQQAAPPGLETDSAPTLSTLSLNVELDALPPAESARKSILHTIHSFKTMTDLNLFSNWN